MKRTAFVTALAAVALVLLPTSATADHGTDSASGHVELFGFQLDFSARSSAAGIGARGHARVTVTNVDPNNVISGEVTCLRVVGGTGTTPALATIGVKVTQAPPGDPTQSLIITASDWGKFSQAPDAANTFFSPLPPPPDGFCPTPGFTAPVTSGEITIHNTLP